jgi:hypothetical protein
MTRKMQDDGVALVMRMTISRFADISRGSQRTARDAARKIRDRETLRRRQSFGDSQLDSFSSHDFRLQCRNNGKLNWKTVFQSYLILSKAYCMGFTAKLIISSP